MLKFISFIISAPLTVLFLLFVLSNTENITLGLWPFATTFSAPLYLFFLVTVIISCGAGATLMWLSQHKYRAEARRARREATALRETIGRPPTDKATAA